MSGGIALSAWLLYGANLVIVTALIAGAVIIALGKTPIARRSAVFRVSGVTFLILCAVTHVELAFHAAVGAHLINDDGTVSDHMWMLHTIQAVAAWTFLSSAVMAAARHFPPEGSRPIADDERGL